MPYPKIPADVRFHQRYQIDKRGCWLWTGSADSDGYGTFQLAKRATIRAHRFGFELLRGPIPSGMFVCHTCDVPGCVNPSHLYIGTPADNMRDKALKGRAPTTINPMPGERNGRAKLSEDDVVCIREIHAELGTKILSTMFGVHASTIQAIMSRKLWAYL